MKEKSDPWLVALLLLPGCGLIVLLVGAVVVMAVVQSVGYFNFAGESGFTLSHWKDQMSSHRLWRSFGYSLKIATLSSVLSVLAAYPLALWFRKPFKGSAFISSLLKAPLLVHGLVAAFLYVNFISFNGFLNQLLMFLGLIHDPIRMQNDERGIGVIILQLWKQMPFALLLLTGAVQAIGDDILLAAQDLGAPAFARFRKVIAPLTLKSLQAALVIIFIGAAGDYSFQVIAGPVNVNSITQYMYIIQNESGGWNQAAVVAVMLMAFSLVGSLALAAIAQAVVKRGQA